MNRANRPRMSRISGSSYDSRLMSRSGDGSTLSLDFTAMGGVLDPRLTFSRASTATFVNSSGYVEYAGANLLLQSETISTSPWVDQNGATRLQVSITNPIGGATATQVTSGGPSNAISQGPTYQAGLPHVIRIWVRAGTSSQLQLGVFAGGFVTGTISVISGTATVSDTGLFLVTGLTATWTQLQIVYPSFTGSGAFLIYPDTASPVAGRTIYVWGAQLNPGSTAQTYYPTTTAAYHAPRFDYSPTNIGEPRGLLVEGQTSNIIRYSSAPQSWVAAVSGTTITDGSGLAPDNSSTPKQLAMTSGGYCYQVTQATQVAGTYTYSVWLKASSNQSVGIRIARTGDGAVKGMITAAVTTTWTRFEVQIASNATDTLDCGFDQRSIPPSVPGPGVAATFLMWGAQLEAGSGASSYIPTGASGVTRNKDSMTLSDLSALGITNTAGTLVADFTNSTENNNYAANLSFRSAVGSTYASRFRWASNAVLTTYFQSDGSTGFTTNLNGSRTSFARCKAATSYSYDGTTTSVFGSMNGAAMSTTSTTTQAASIAIPTSLRWNDDGSTPSATDYSSLVMRSVKYYPSCLTIAQMNTLTTL